MNIFDRKVTVSIEIDTNQLGSYTDEFLCTCWHVAQGNPAEFGDEKAGELVEAVGHEIIRRWLKAQAPAIYHHARQNHYWDILRKNGKWVEGQWTPNPIAGPVDGG